MPCEARSEHLWSREPWGGGRLAQVTCGGGGTTVLASIKCPLYDNYHTGEAGDSSGIERG